MWYISLDPEYKCKHVLVHFIYFFLCVCVCVCVCMCVEERGTTFRGFVFYIGKLSRKNKCPWRGWVSLRSIFYFHGKFFVVMVLVMLLCWLNFGYSFLAFLWRLPKLFGKQNQHGSSHTKFTFLLQWIICVKMKIYPWLLGPRLFVRSFTKAIIHALLLYCNLRLMRLVIN